MKLQKAAMFGLDARIALAIFGALSVISGAALYSAIQESKLVATYTGFQELIKAQEALYLDNGTLQTSTDKTMFVPADLLADNNLAGWAGPYIDGTAVTTGPDLMLVTPSKPADFTLRLRNVKTANWEPADLWAAIGCATNSESCTTSIQLTKNAATDPLGALLDERFDDGVNNTGNIRYGQLGASSVYYIYIFGFTYNAR
tara:strand:+ start:6278 stop:6880 length:603 start_codon:yes stop_codon:yes gene_type:complete